MSCTTLPFCVQSALCLILPLDVRGALCLILPLDVRGALCLNLPLDVQGGIEGGLDRSIRFGLGVHALLDSLLRGYGLIAAELSRKPNFKEAGQP